MVVVGIAGKLGSGKSAIAAHLVAEYGFTQVSFADALKLEVAQRLRRTVLTIVKGDTAWWVRYAGYVSAHGRGTSDDDMLHYALHVDRVPAVRALLQEYGTECRRADMPDYWVREWRWSVHEIESNAGTAVRLVAPDVRFRNEAEAVIGIPGQGRLWRIVRPGFDGDSHASETQLDGWKVDAEFSNVGDLDDLHNLVDVHCELIGIPRIPTIPEAR